MCVGDGLDDREAEPGPAAWSGSMSLESVERLEEPPELHRRDDRAGIGDDEHGLPSRGTCRNFQSAAGEVVTGRVRDEVRNEPLDENGVAVEHRRLELADALEVAEIEGAKRVIRDCRQVDPVTADEPAAAAGKGEARLEQPFLLQAGVEDIPSDFPPGGSIRERIGESQLEEGTLRRQWRAQLVRKIGGKAFLADCPIVLNRRDRERSPARQPPP